MNNNNNILIAILAKEKNHVLPEYLACIESQTYPKSLIHLWIRTNNNKDDTAITLKRWVNRVGSKYASVHFDDSNVSTRVEDYGQHEWNAPRLNVLCAIRNESIEAAKKLNAHFFIADCDNFIAPHTLQKLADTGLPAVAPFLTCKGSGYSNYHHCADGDGYFKNCAEYGSIQTVPALHEVDVIHCTYFIRNSTLPFSRYVDGTGRYDYVILSHGLRQSNQQQYLDTREVYGCLTFAESRAEFLAQENPLPPFSPASFEPLPTEMTQVFSKMHADGEFSGVGSFKTFEPFYEKFLLEFIQRNNVKSVIDLGCGVGESFLLDNNSVIGIDCVDNNTQNQFRICFDFEAHPELIPSGDLCLIKDVFQYWPSETISKFLRYLISAKLFKYILITTHTNQTKEQRGGVVGEFKQLSPSLPPLCNFNPTVVLSKPRKGTCLIKL